MKADAQLIAAFAPAGTLRVSINVGNPVLAARRAGVAQPYGVSVDLAVALGARLGVPVELRIFDAAGKSVQAVAEEQVDVGFFAIDPLREVEIAFTAPYVLVEGSYLVRDDSPIRCNEQVDRPDNRIAVGQGSAYDLYLTRELHHANIIRVATSAEVVTSFLRHGLEVAAGVRQQLQSDVRPGLRVLDGRFMIIRQAMGLPRRRGEAAVDFLQVFIEEMKESGFVQQALIRHGVAGASVAPCTGV
ncbi:ABC transporter substrate-binding protein [Paraburkholderia sp. BCC1884]|uniref:ABC transporter substrate-binding protein n=1 Tax=Paraburkholderia sp. BCC1884 TaxID=2562668 RepID=UPI00118296F6|nr:ABC transporter substrate-binding protein [Paraburkholderia sp. BCC1884]